MTNLSVVIISKNEAHNIERCIQSCLPLGCEILVIDSHSTDGTSELAQNLGAQVIPTDWKGYGPTKNYGASLAKQDWILSLDADEALNEKLQQAVLECMNSEPNRAAYWLPRTLVFIDKILIYGAVRNEKRLRLYNRTQLEWNDKSVHEELVKKVDTPTYFGELNGSLLHYSYTDLTDMKIRMDKYARLSAENLKQKSKASLHVKRLLNPLVSFIKNYFFNIGFADGKLGYVFAREQAIYVFKKYKYALKN